MSPLGRRVSTVVLKVSGLGVVSLPGSTRGCTYTVHLSISYTDVWHTEVGPGCPDAYTGVRMSLWTHGPSTYSTFTVTHTQVYVHRCVKGVLLVPQHHDSVRGRDGRISGVRGPVFTGNSTVCSVVYPRRPRPSQRQPSLDRVRGYMDVYGNKWGIPSCEPSSTLPDGPVTPIRTQSTHSQRTSKTPGVVRHYSSGRPGWTGTPREGLLPSSGVHTGSVPSHPLPPREVGRLCRRERVCLREVGVGR